MLRLLALRSTNQEIAARLYISIRTSGHMELPREISRAGVAGESDAVSY